MTVIVCIITACLQKKSKILRGIRRFFFGVIHTIGVKQDLKDGGRFLFGARDSFFIQLIRLDNQNGPEAHALKPAPFQDDEGDEKTFTLAPGMKLGIDATLGNDVNLDVAPAQKAGIRLTFTNAKFVLRGMELLNPNPREIVAYDKIDYCCASRGDEGKGRKL